MKALAVSVCGTMITAGVLRMLCREEDRVMRLSLRVFFLLSLVSPFVSADFSAEELFPDFSETEASVAETAETRLLSAAKELLSARAEKILEEQGVSAESVDFTLHRNEDGSIDIISLLVTFPPGELEKGAAASPALVQAFGVTPEITERTEDSGKRNGEAEKNRDESADASGTGACRDASDLSFLADSRDEG